MPITFFSGKNDKFVDGKIPDDDEKRVDFLKARFSDLLEIKHLSFLMGAGCSSVKDPSGKECGIPAMVEMTKQFIGQASTEVKNVIAHYQAGEVSNIELFLGYLYRKHQSLVDEQAGEESQKPYAKAIEETKKFLNLACRKQCDDVQQIYEMFYRKLLLRSNNLPKVNLFTTNYDLYNERALDALDVIYCNGFSGFIDRRYNPGVFKHGLYTELDIKGSPLTHIDNFIFLFKLHGSINWIKRKSPRKLLDITEIQEFNAEQEYADVMIYPTPHKQEDSFGLPYSDIFREFQTRLGRPNNVLVTIGYGFNDDHINSIIFRALIQPSFRLVILGDYAKGTIARLVELDDSRIWVIGGDHENEKMHYFKSFVDKMLPDIEANRMEKQIRKTEEGLLNLEALKEKLND